MDKLLECKYPLGLENGAISDSQISASSQWDSAHSPARGRLHLRDEEKAGAWSARANDGNQWLQIDLGGQETKVTRVGTQGRNDNNQRVTKYKLQYGNDEESLQYFKEEGQSADKVRQQIFSGMYSELDGFKMRSHTKSGKWATDTFGFDTFNKIRMKAQRN